MALLPKSRIHDFTPLVSKIIAKHWEEEFDQIANTINNTLMVPLVMPFFFSTSASGTKSEMNRMPYGQYTTYITKIRLIYQTGGATGTTTVEIYVNDIATGRTASLAAGSVASTVYEISTPSLQVDRTQWVSIKVTADGGHNNLTVILCGTTNTVMYLDPGVPPGYTIPPDTAARDTRFLASQVISSDKFEAEIDRYINFVNNTLAFIHHTWYYPSQPTTAEIQRDWIVPPLLTTALGYPAAIDGAQIWFRAGAASNTLAFDLKKNGTTVKSFSIGSGNALGAAHLFDFYPTVVTLAEDDFISLVCTDQSGTQSEVSVSVNGTQGLDPTGGIARLVNYGTPAFTDTVDSAEWEPEFDQIWTLLNTNRFYLNYFTVFTNNPQTSTKFMQYTGSPDLGARVATITKVKAIFRSGSASGTKTATLEKNGIVIATISLSGAGDPINTTKSVTLSPSQALTSGDILKWVYTVDTGSQRDITLSTVIRAEMI